MALRSLPLKAFLLISGLSLATPLPVAASQKNLEETDINLLSHVSSPRPTPSISSTNETLAPFPVLQFDPFLFKKYDLSSPRRYVLSFDGGGIRGLLPTTLLNG